MGLPSYIINFEEITEYIMEAIASSNIKLDVDELVLDASSLKIDLTPIEKLINGITEEHKTQTGYIQNGSNTLEQIKGLLEELKDNKDDNILVLLEKMVDLCKYAKRTNEILHGICDVVGGYDGDLRIEGKRIIVLSNVTNTEYIAKISVEKDSVLTGLAIASTSYTDVDSWSLYIGEKALDPVFENIYIKPYGDRKDFRKSIVVPAGESVILKFNNLSRSGKSVFVDFEYIELFDDLGDDE